MANTFLQAGPLDSRTPIVDQRGWPTPYFLQQWQRQRNVVVTVEGVQTSLTAIETSVEALQAQTVSGGTGISGGGRLDGAKIVLSLTNTGVTPGTYGNESQVARITVDAQGRVTGVTEVDITGAGGGGGVPTSRQINTGTGLSGGGDLSADRTIVLTNTTVTPGTYGSSTQVPQFTVDAQGRITGVSEVAVSGGGGGVPTSRTITAGTGLSGGGDLSQDRTINLTNTTVTPGTYGSSTQVPQFTVDAQGRITGVTEVAVSGGGGGGGGSGPPVWAFYSNTDTFFTDTAGEATKGVYFKPFVDVEVRGVAALHRTTSAASGFGSVIAEMTGNGSSDSVVSVVASAGASDSYNAVQGSNDMMFSLFSSPVTLSADTWYFIGASRRGDGDTAGFTIIKPSSSSDVGFITIPGETENCAGFEHETLSNGDVPDSHDSERWFAGPLV